jgi:hypothetical protein
MTKREADGTPAQDFFLLLKQGIHEDAIVFRKAPCPNFLRFRKIKTLQEIGHLIYGSYTVFSDTGNKKASVNLLNREGAATYCKNLFPYVL